MQSETDMKDGLIKELKIAIRGRRLLTESNNRIYLVNEEVIGKVHTWEGPARTEYDIGSFVFKNDISGPEFYQLVHPEDPSSNPLSRIFNKRVIKKWFTLMQKIDGALLGNLRGSELEEAVRQLKSELEKVLELGVYPDDSLYPSNSIFNRCDGRLYLIDFESWSKNPTENELNGFYERLKGVSPSLYSK